jgi:hypothetical protein
MRRPLTKYYGAQVEKIFRGQGALSERRLLYKDIACLTKDKEAVQIVDELRACLECLDALARMHQQVSIPRPDIQVLKAAVTSCRDSLRFFSSSVTLGSCRSTAKFYDGAIRDRIVEKCKRLPKYGLSPCCGAKSWKQTTKTSKQS